MNAFAVNLQEIVISDLQEGIFLVSWFVIQTMILLKLIVELAML
jgi:hypothetical protein